MNNQKLILKKCAYIFHWSNNTISYGSKKDIELKNKTNKILEEYYYNEELRNKPIHYTIVNNQYIIKIDDIRIILNDNMIEKICDKPNHIINHLKNKNVVGLADDKRFNTHNFKNCIYSIKYKSLYCECFTCKDDLGFYRIHFKNNYYCFVVDERDNELYSFYGSSYKHITIDDIISYLDVTSNNAIEELKIIIEYIQDNSR